MIIEFKRSLRNSWFNAWTQAVGLAGSLALSVLLARLAGVQALGLYSWASAIVSVFIGLASCGVSTTLAREVARDPARGPRWAANGMGMALAISLPIGIASALVVGWGLGLTVDALEILLLCAGVQSVRNVRGAAFGYLQGSSAFGIVTALETVAQVATLTIGGVVLWYGQGLARLLTAFLVVEVCMVVAWQIATSHGLSLRSWRYLARAGLPVAITGLGQTLNLRVDAVMLGLMSGPLAVGLYTAASSAYLALVTFWSALMLGFFPSLAELAQRDRTNFRRLARTATASVGAASLGSALLLATVAAPVIAWLYGEPFRAAAAPLLALCVAIPLATLARLMTMVLTALDHQDRSAYAVALGVGVHVAANGLLIPRLGPLGCGIAVALGETASLLAALAFVVRPARRFESPAVDVAA